jgi:hypothetical protein
MIAPLKSKPCFTEAEFSKAMPMFYVVGKKQAGHHVMYDLWMLFNLLEL